MISTKTRTAQPSVASQGSFRLPFPGRGISRKSIYTFTRDLSIMLSARMLLTDSIHTLALQTENSRFQNILDDIVSRLKAGSSLADCLRTYPRLFGSFYVNLVEVGELTGRLDEMLNRVSLYLEKISDLKRKLLQAMTYPSLVIAVAILSLGFVIYYVIPTFSGIFHDFNSELPWITLMVLGISDFMKANTLYLMGSLLVLVYFIYRGRQNEKFQTFYDRFLLNIPLIGELIRKNYISQFCRTLGTLLGSGVSLLSALEVSSRSLQNHDIRQDINNMIYFAKKGEKLTRSLSQSRIFPLMVTQMITVGEETAELPLMLLKIADHYDKEIDSSLETLSSVIEPVVIILLGIIIGTILISIYLPLFNLSSVMPG